MGSPWEIGIVILTLSSRRPVIIEVPHFAALRNKEREIVILRSDNGESWKEHTLEATEDAVQDVLQESFDADEMNQIEDLNTNRITRILTTDFPQYFAIVSRIRQEVHAIGPQGGVVNSTVVPQVQAVFPQGALTKKIKVGLQVSTLTPGIYIGLSSETSALISLTSTLFCLQVSMFRPRRALQQQHQNGEVKSGGGGGGGDGTVGKMLLKKITVNHLPKKKKFSIIW